METSIRLVLSSTTWSTSTSVSEFKCSLICSTTTFLTQAQGHVTQSFIRGASATECKTSGLAKHNVIGTIDSTYRGFEVEVEGKLPALDLQSAYNDVKAQILGEKAIVIRLSKAAAELS